MEEVSTIQAAKIIHVTRMTVYNCVEDGLLPARRIGRRRAVRIKIDDLREFAKKYGYDFDEGGIVVPEVKVENQGDKPDTVPGQPEECPYCQSEDIQASSGHWECVDCGQEGSY